MGTPAKDIQRLKANVSGVDLWMGVDPGTHTGFAVWNPKLKQFLRVETMKAVEAEHTILLYHGGMKLDGLKLHVVVEDTRNIRLPKNLQNPGREMGAGSVRREAGRWAEFLEYHNISHTMAGLSPKEFRKSTQEWFSAKFGWTKRTSIHGRCAAGLIAGR